MRIGHAPTESRTRETGATLVEFAIIAPLLLILVFGVIETGRAIFAYTTVWSAARDGARAATTSESFASCDNIEAAALVRVFTVQLESADITIEYTDPDGTLLADCQGGTPPSPAVIPSGSLVSVNVEGTFDSVVPILSNFLDGLTLDSSQQRVIYLAEEVGGP